MRLTGRIRTELESRWFDFRHGVHTHGDVTPDKMIVLGPNTAHAVLYNPTHLRSGRQVFRDLPVADFSRYIFIDFGRAKDGCFSWPLNTRSVPSWG
jgi:hypothetical protein